MLDTSIEIKILNKQSNLERLRWSRFKYFLNTYLKLFIPKQCYLPVTSQNATNTLSAQELNSFVFRWPLFILIISIIQLAVFNFDLVQTNEHESNLRIEKIGRSLTGPATELLIFDPQKHHEFWRYVTYIFVHVGHDHLIVNIVIQIFLGIPLEMVYGSFRIIILYMSSVICAVEVATTLNPTIYLAGASGGVYALLGAHIATIIINLKNIYSPGLQLLVFVMVGLIDIGLSIGSNRTGTSYLSHIVGVIIGFVFGLVLNKKLKLILFKMPIGFWKYFVLLVIVSGLLIFLIRSLVFEHNIIKITTDTSSTTQILNVSNSSE